MEIRLVMSIVMPLVILIITTILVQLIICICIYIIMHVSGSTQGPHVRGFQIAGVSRQYSLQVLHCNPPNPSRKNDVANALART